ncbi:MAG TPA: alpha/beta hydrolase fold domain-containing protein [Acidimicrobiales bacterium]|nr:alpha/beta hydrolase fold domain-containing protein [Acidimicrobiales bacterium]
MVVSGNGSTAATDEVDVVVVGAGFSGLYMLHRLRKLGFSTVVFDEAGDVGGTWYWNRYPGARCDIPTTDYTYSFDHELDMEWTWSEKYATQPEILAYLGHVADRYDLRKDIQFNTRIASAKWDEVSRRWSVVSEKGNRVDCRYYVMATGCLSLPKVPDVEGVDRFDGDIFFTGRWPHEKVDFTGKRVAVIGTGSSGIQSIPLIAEEASELVVFQRTANFSFPAHNGPASPERLAAIAKDRDSYRHEARNSRAGMPYEMPELSGLTATEEQRRERFERAWEKGELLAITGMFIDELSNPVVNDMVADLFREKVREIVNDPRTAESLCPGGFPIGTKRACLDTDYYRTFNLPHVRLVDLRRTPIKTVTEAGIDTAEESFEFDAIVFATGFDAMTGPLVSVDITGVDGLTLKAKWADGPTTYLGLVTTGFPNLFTITGPQSPSVLSNMAISIEQHVDWVAECLRHMRAEGLERIEPTLLAESGWVQHNHDCADITLFQRANSWYMGANVPGKPRVFLPYVGGVDGYRKACDEVVELGYLGFELEGAAGVRCNDGVIRRIQPDVAIVLELMASLGLPPLESMSPDEARAFMESTNAERPPGPEVGEIVDGILPGAAGDLDYRLYRPDTAGPHPIIVYFHGGGWVLGNQVSDEPLCRDICVRTGSTVVSVNYRHAPEARFPAAADDAFAAVRWVGANAPALGGAAGQLVVAGWSAGGNIAAVAAQRARDAGGPSILAQLLLTPVTDWDPNLPSLQENAEGYVLTASLMKWFWDNYADEPDRIDPRVSPLRGELAGLPPAVIVTADFDPLRDEGVAYGDALASAGVPVRHVRARGHIHTSVPMVDLVISGAPVRAEMCAALGDLMPTPVRS